MDVRQDPGRDANFGALGGWTGRGETSSAQIDLVFRARGRTVATLRDFDAAFIISIHRPNPDSRCGGSWWRAMHEQILVRRLCKSQ
ncbi:hypothetical protein PVAP13_9KG141600 [Panicum virgatum]|uniref:Uncharacterized protein n=1 Tax=Panicum virgatum TaxID=38727 RepID=A0A8T0NI68_PANVG|nr:hypothetical protein PVAP13_9KG141600 [Panicum virgatum]